MKTLSLVIFFILICQSSFCQEKKLSIENHVSNKEIIIKENRMIKVVTKTGEKFSGRLMVLDQNTIAVDGVILDLNEIDNIRRHSLFVTILVKANFFHMGSVACLLSVIPGGLPILLVGVAILAGGVYAGVKFPKNARKYKAENNWIFKIEGLPEAKVTFGNKPIEQFLFTNNRLPYPENKEPKTINHIK